MSGLERLFSLLTKIRPGEGRGILLLGLNGFLVVCAYYVLKTLRESMILSEFGAETKAYAVAAIAVVLFFVVPLYGVLFRNTNRTQLVIAINSFFIVNLAMFYVARQAGMSIAFQYYVWIGIFGVMVVAQFWAYVTDIYNVRSGQRIFPVIMIATSLGGLAGAKISALAFPVLGTFGLMALAGALLTLSMTLYRPARLAAPEDSRCIECEFIKPRYEGLFGGFAIVVGSRYLCWIALFVVLLNWINSTGEYILSVMVVEWADAQLAAGANDSDKETLIAWFYGNFSFWVTLISLLLQTLLVARILRLLGLPRALMVLPVLAALGYLLIAFIPIFSIIRIAKVAENAVDYSLMSTIRQALFLPTSQTEKYEGKTAIDTFFWRFGDLIQGAAIYVGINFLEFGVAQFAVGNAVLAIIWIAVAVMIAGDYLQQVSVNATSRPPELIKPIPDQTVATGQAIQWSLDSETFVDPDPGDVIQLSASLADGSALPPWLMFNPRSRHFSGTAPVGQEALHIKVTASDFEHLTASDCFTVRFVSR
jgi:AAA family ATP:ADP antiporter